jgi:hypothetical protein
VESKTLDLARKGTFRKEVLERVGSFAFIAGRATETGDTKSDMASDDFPMRRSGSLKTWGNKNNMNDPIEPTPVTASNTSLKSLPQKPTSVSVSQIDNGFLLSWWNPNERVNNGNHTLYAATLVEITNKLSDIFG